MEGGSFRGFSLHAWSPHRAAPRRLGRGVRACGRAGRQALGRAGRCPVPCARIAAQERQQGSAPPAGSVRRLRQALLAERTFLYFGGGDLQVSLKGESGE